MAHLQPQIPQGIEDRFDHLLPPWRLLPGRQEHDVDVGKRRHLAAPIAAHRRQREPLGSRRVVQRIEPAGREIEQQAQYLVGEKGVGCRRSEEHTSELQSLMRTPYAVLGLKKKTKET